MSSEPTEAKPAGDPADIDDLPRTPVDPKGSPHVLLHMPAGGVRSVALGVLTVIAVLAVLRWASGIFIPLMLGLVFTYALSPVVDWLHRRKVPRALSAAVLILGILGSMGGAVYSLTDDANALVESLPDAARKVRDSVQKRSQKKSDSTLETVQKAATEPEKAAQAAGGSSAAPARGVARVVVGKPRLDLREYLLSGTLGLASGAGQVVMVTVFIGVLAWGWLWGVWGLLLGIPILMAVKAVCDRVDHLKPVGELLGT